MTYLLFISLRELFRHRRDLVTENLALRQQILVLERANPKPPFKIVLMLFGVVK